MEGTAETFYPETRVLVFDALIFKNDIDTPLSMTIKSATVIKWYGYRHPKHGIYPNMVDIIFDHRPDRVSHGHFVDVAGIPYIEKIEGKLS